MATSRSTSETTKEMETRVTASISQRVVWFDPHINNSENSSYVDYLTSVKGVQLHATSDRNNAIEQFSTMQQGTEYRAITAGNRGTEFVKKVRSMGILCPILVFTGNEKKHSKWACKYDNVEVTTSATRMFEFATWNQ